MGNRGLARLSDVPVAGGECEEDVPLTSRTSVNVVNTGVPGMIFAVEWETVAETGDSERNVPSGPISAMDGRVPEPTSKNSEKQWRGMWKNRGLEEQVCRRARNYVRLCECTAPDGGYTYVRRAKQKNTKADRSKPVSDRRAVSFVTGQALIPTNAHRVSHKFKQTDGCDWHGPTVPRRHTDVTNLRPQVIEH